MSDTRSDQQVHEGETENGQKQEPEPSRDANVCAAYWVARQMLDGPVDGFSREAWVIALDALVEAMYIAAKRPERDSVPAVDQRAERAPSRSTPDDALTPPAVSPEAAPPRATTPEPMTEDADATFLLNYAAALRHSAEAKRKRGFVFGPECVDVQAPIFERIADRLRAPSRDSGALLDEYAEASRLRGEFRAVGADGFAAEHATLADAARKELDARLSTLERDAARMDRLETMRGKLGRSGYIVIHTMQNETVREHIDTLADRVAALAPSVESR